MSRRFLFLLMPSHIQLLAHHLGVGLKPTPFFIQFPQIAMGIGNITAIEFYTVYEKLSNVSTPNWKILKYPHLILCCLDVL